MKREKRICDVCKEPMFSSWAGEWIDGKFIYIHEKCKMENENIQVQQRESIKLKKNTKEIYEWEIKLIGEELLIDDNTIKRLGEIDDKLKKRYSIDYTGREGGKK